ncbi:MAG: hypothetical protein Q8R92_00875, partial [Deltaproteobacteria bacterium]|nr:hypothetical protein [Deltaproteobacteria bacterium]
PANKPPVSTSLDLRLEPSRNLSKGDHPVGFHPVVFFDNGFNAHRLRLAYPRNPLGPRSGDYWITDAFSFSDV